MTTATMDFDGRQQVEGFAKVVSQSGIRPSVGREVGPDYRGPIDAATTPDWWRVRQPDEPDLVWLTANLPEAVDTTFSFVGESANLPENLYPTNQATLYANGEAVLTFDLGQRARKSWIEGDWGLEFIPKQVHTTVDGYHRQFWAGGCCGIYRLAAPARALEAGQPLRLKVVLELERSDAINWFAVRPRTDVLEVSPRTNGEQIERLQQELIHLKRVVGALARRSYPELLEERLPTEDVIVYSNGRAHVHDSDLLRLHNGDLLVILREASEHLSCDGKMVTVRSTDGGKTGGDRQVLREHSDTDEREGSLAQLRDGTILANYWNNAHYDHQGRYLGAMHNDPLYRGRPHGLYIGRSTDDGHTWTWSEKGIDPDPLDEVHSSERIVELESGRLLMATYFRPTGEDRMASGVFSSDDQGYTWRYLSTMANVPGVALGEPALVQTLSGGLISLVRNETDPAYYQTVSADGGETWSPAVPSPIPGHRNPASLLTLPNGTVLCVYGSRGDPAGIYVVASYDEGETWDMAHRRVIRDDFPNRDIGYPSTVLMPDGRVLAVYYFNMFDRFFIVGSFFRWE